MRRGAEREHRQPSPLQPPSSPVHIPPASSQHRSPAHTLTAALLPTSPPLNPGLSVVKYGSCGFCPSWRREVLTPPFGTGLGGHPGQHKSTPRIPSPHWGVGPQVAAPQPGLLLCRYFLKK